MTKPFAYVKDRPYAPKGHSGMLLLHIGIPLHSDADAHFDTVVVLQGEEIEPQVSWGTSPRNGDSSDSSCTNFRTSQR